MPVEIERGMEAFIVVLLVREEDGRGADELRRGPKECGGTDASRASTP
jgi:hypothetical protein